VWYYRHALLGLATWDATVVRLVSVTSSESISCTCFALLILAPCTKTLFAISVWGYLRLRMPPYSPDLRKKRYIRCEAIGAFLHRSLCRINAASIPPFSYPEAGTGNRTSVNTTRLPSPPTPKSKSGKITTHNALQLLCGCLSLLGIPKKKCIQHQVWCLQADSGP
jgi:hypothetical protein